MKALNETFLKEQVSYHRNKFRKTATVTKLETTSETRQYSYEIVFIPQEKKQDDSLTLVLNTEDSFTKESFNCSDCKTIISRINEFEENEKLKN